MRPIRLELKGFSTFREQTVIDFAGVDLMAFVGPTGSGKSTIIDGIIFALYGSVARYKSSNLVAPVINQLSNEARIRLDFAIGETTYTTVRVVRRTATGATTKEARLESSSQVLAGNASELDAAIEQLLGLTFDQFTKTVVLPQGEFARFLTESPEARQSLLRRLLGMELYRSMGSAARTRSRTAEIASAALIEQREDRRPVTDETVAEAAAALDSLAAIRDELVDHVTSVEVARADDEAAKVAVEKSTRMLALLSTLEVPPAAKKLTTALEDLTLKREAAKAAAEVATETLAKETEAAADHASIDELERLLIVHGDVDDLTSQLSLARATLADETKSLDLATLLEQDADVAIASLEARRNTAHERAGVAGLRHRLELGEPCPVCEHVVDRLPTHDPAEELADLDEQIRAHKEQGRQLTETRRLAERAQSRAMAETESLESRLATLTEALVDQPDLETTASQLRASRAAHIRVEKATKKADMALSKLRSIDEQRAELEAESLGLQREFLDARDGLAPLNPPSPSGDSPTGDWHELVAWGQAITTQVEASREVAITAAESAAARIAVHQASIAQLCEPHVAGAVPEEPVEWIAAELGRARAELAAIEAEHDAQAKSDERIATLQTEAAVSGELGRLLNARGFEQWLMADVMHTLANRATDRLLELSGGAYSLLTDGTDFSIRDHRNADEVRGARTLSGGETFLASLSLALALADNISTLASDGAPQIESMFLDEGFGTLDVETLDVVASAIEELGAAGRMIGVVTHIRELADRIPVRFEVSRASGGSVVERTTLG